MTDIPFNKKSRTTHHASRTFHPSSLIPHPLSLATRHSSLLLRYSLLITIFLAFIFRIHSLTFQSLWRDEVDAICFAQAPLLPALPETQLAYTPSCAPGIQSVFGAFLSGGWNGPLYFLMLRGWLGLSGSSEFALRFLSLAFGVISIALIFVLGKRLFNRAIGLIAAILLAFSAYQVWYSQEAKMYTLITMLSLAAIYFLRRGIEDGQRKFWIGVIVCTSLAMYAHILAALLIPVEVVLFLVWWRSSKTHLRAGLITFALLTVPYIPLALWQIPLIFQPAETGFGHYTFGQMLEVLGNAYTLGILSPFVDWQIQVAIGFSAALAVLGLLEAKFSISHRLGLLLWAAIPFSAIFLVSINRPIFTDRYLIWIEAAYTLLIAIGIYALWKWRKPIGLVALIGLCAISFLSLNAQATTPFKPDFRSAAHAIETAIMPVDAIVFQIPHVRYNFDYYFRLPHQSIDGPYTNFTGNANGYRDSEEMVFENLAAQFQNVKSVWLVLSEEDMWDQRHLLRRYLDTHGTLTYQATYAYVEVRWYELK
jgi:hypothetical protein